MAPKISFCVTCRNRWYQLRETIGHNLRILEQHELVVVNYGSRDEMHIGMDAYKKEMESGKLKYFKTDDPKNYHCPKAKNLAHRLASNEFLFNLDGDNFLDEKFIEELESIFSEHPYGIIHAYDHEKYVPGTFGRIGIHRDNFYAVGGYNESFMPMSFQDNDFILRLNYIGLPYICTNVMPPNPIFNKIERKGNDTSRIGGVDSYNEYRKLNFHIAFSRLNHIGPILEQNFSTFKGSINFGEEFILNGYMADVSPLHPERPQEFSSKKFKSAELLHFESVLNKKDSSK